MIEEKKINPAEIIETCNNLKETYDYLVFVTAVDYPEKKIIELVYFLRSVSNKNSIMLKVELDRESPKIASVAGIWPAADWHEREVFDLFGVTFIGHPDLRRILLPEDWDGYPLRKDYSKPKTILRPETVK